MTAIERDVATTREMLRQGVVSDHRLKGPLGHEIRAERREMYEALVKAGVALPSVLDAPV